MREDLRQRIAALTPGERDALLQRLGTRGTAPRDAAPGCARDAPLQAPLSAEQRQVWFAAAAGADASLYNIGVGVDVSGALEAARLERALRVVTDRHGALRTAFFEVDGEPHQRVEALAGLPLAWVDLLGLPASTQRRLVEEVGRRLARRPYALHRAPAWRAAVIRLAAQRHRLLMCFHHLVADGHAIGLVIEQICEAYAGTHDRHAAPGQYLDYAASQAAPRLAAPDVAHWSRVLGDAPPGLPLHRAAAAPGAARAGTKRSVVLPADVTRGLRDFCARRRTTLYAAAASAVGIVLHRAYDVPELLLACPTTTRESSALDDVVGLFVNTLPLRLDLRANPSLDAVVAGAHDRLLACLEHRAPLERIVREVPGIAGHGESLFQVAVDYQRARRASMRARSVAFEVVEMDSGVSTFDMTFYLLEREHDLVLTLEHDTHSVTRVDARRLLARVERVLRTMVAQPEIRLQRLPLRPRARAPAAGRGVGPQTSTAWPSLAHAVLGAAARWPDATAVADGGQRVSYATLARWSGEIAAHLREQGLGRGEVVGLCGRRSAAFIAAALGVLRAGAAYLPLDPELPLERARELLHDARAARVLALPGAPRDLPRTAAWTLDAPPAGASPAPDAVCAARDDTAYVMYTSGSTGRPKGVLVRHGEILSLVEDCRYSGIAQGARVGHGANIGFDAATFEIWSPLVHGATVVVLDTQRLIDPEAVARLLRGARLDVLFLTTSLMHLVADLCPGAFGGLRTLIVGGEACDAARVRRLFESGSPPQRLVNGYGPTETVTFSAFHVMTGAVSGPTVPIGTALADQRLYVLDSYLEPVPAGAEGELFIGGAIALGYVNRPGDTAARFVPDPFATRPGARMYRTGDRVRWRRDGTLEFRGRRDRQAKLRGFRIEPAEVEAAVRACPGVRHAAVELESGGATPRLTAYVAGPQAPEALEALREAVAARLPAVMVPGAWRLVPTIPLTPNGKTDWSALRRLGACPSPGGQASLPPSSVAARIAATWRALLEREDIGAHDSFFDVGGHSLLAARLVARLREAGLGPLGIRDVFEHPTVDELARLLERRRAAAPDATGLPSRIHRQRFAGDPPLSLFQERLWFLAQLDPHSAAYNSCALFTVDAPVDAPALARALALVVARHETLRTLVSWEDGLARQRIQPPAGGAPLAIVDLAGLPPARREGLAERVCRAEGSRPVDLEHGPPLRALLLESGAESGLLMVVVHHMVFDLRSQHVLRAELCAAYEAARAGVAPGLPELTVSYADFACWQRLQASEAAFVASEAWWRSVMADPPPPIRWRRAARGGLAGRAHEHGAVHPLALDDALGGRILELATQRGVSAFVPLASALAVLMQREGDGREVMFGFDVAQRPTPELEHLIGFFVNVLVLRVQLESATPFAELMERVRAASRDAHRHGRVPFDRIVAGVAGPRRGPPIQVLFSLREGGAPCTARGPIHSLEVRESSTARWDLALVMHAEEGRLRGHWIHRLQALDPSSMSRLSSDFTDILSDAMSRPDVAPRSSPTPHAPEVTMKSHLASSLDSFLARPATTRAQALADFAEVDPERVLPAVVRPLRRDVDPVAWARANRERIDAALLARGAVLFDGFRVASLPVFQSLAQALCGELFADYGDLPREPANGDVYHATPYPPEECIAFHNEGVHTGRWPSRIFFYCAQRARTAGETPLADTRAVHARLDADVLARFRRLGVRYVRNFHTRQDYLFGLDLSWQGFFHTSDRAQVEAQCRTAGLEHAWLDDGGLRIVKVAPVCGRHPATGEAIFFQQILTHHVSSLDPGLRASIESLFEPDALPRNAYYGDGSPIDDDTVAHVRAAYAACARVSPWQEGNVLMVDNLLASHARDAFTGPRQIYVALGDMMGPESLGGNE